MAMDHPYRTNEKTDCLALKELFDDVHKLSSYREQERNNIKEGICLLHGWLQLISKLSYEIYFPMRVNGREASYVIFTVGNKHDSPAPAVSTHNVMNAHWILKETHPNLAPDWALSYFDLKEALQQIKGNLETTNKHFKNKKAKRLEEEESYMRSKLQDDINRYKEQRK